MATASRKEERDAISVPASEIRGVGCCKRGWRYCSSRRRQGRTDTESRRPWCSAMNEPGVCSVRLPMPSPEVLEQVLQGVGAVWKA